jgi:mono/diheme cytochrome c family protein
MLEPEPKAGVNKLTYHYNSQRTGWYDHESALLPRSVAGPSFGLLWETPTLDYFEGVPPRLFASPLYVNSVGISAGRHKGGTFPALYVVTSTGYVYAVNAFEVQKTPPGTILWRTRLTAKPCSNGTMGNLSTPIIDIQKQRLYVTSCDDDARWQAHAVDIRNGDEVPGWPVDLGHEALNASGINRNGETQFSEKDGHTQRGALNLSPDGSRLYVTFGLDHSSGWLVAVDTKLRKVATAFSTTAVTSEIQGGMWASGGPSVDRNGTVHIATGASSTQAMKHAGIPGVFPDSAHSWGQSILQLKDDPITGFELLGTYTPFNYCLTAANDVDLGSSGTVSIDLDPHKTSTPHLLALGGAKQGNVYLLDRTHMPGGVIKRQPCGDDSASDLSLLAPENQPQFGKRGPVNVFGPYSDVHGMLDQARSRTTLAYYHAATGEDYVYVTGSSKRGEDFSTSTPPGLARVKIITSRGQPAYLQLDQLEQTQTFQNPGSPIVTSSGGKSAIVWVLDINVPRLASLYGAHAPQPVLYAFDALSLKLLWKSAPGVLSPSGKYNEPTIVNAAVFVGTDRVQAFGLRAALPAAALEFEPLFDGSTLSHWRGDPRVWSVQDGAITGKSGNPIDQNVLLLHDGNYRDFELHFKYRFLSERGNFGMRYRSRPYPGHDFSVVGYQANIVTLDAKDQFAMLSDDGARGDLALLGERTDVFEYHGKIEKRVLGLVNTPDAVLSVVKPYPAWNDYAIIAYGNHLVHAVNGVLAVDVIDDDFRGRRTDGTLALQLHAEPPMGVQFKDIRIKELMARPNIARQFVTNPTPAPLRMSTDDVKAARIGKQVYDQRCSMCHGVKESGAPTRETLARLPRGQITDVLVNGLMRDIALGLSDGEINALATYLTLTETAP